MKTKLLICTVLMVSLTILWNNNDGHSFTQKPPVSTTGAPGDLGSCGRTGCHVGEGTNMGGGSLDINFAGGILSYDVGETYDITVNVQETGKAKFGFQMVALDDDDNSVGEFAYTPNNLTMGGGRQYVHHFNANNTNEFSFQWQAPDELLGNVTFYVAANAADGNNMKTGDNIYTETLTITPEIASVDESHFPEKTLQIYPNPIEHDFQVDYFLPKTETIHIHLLDVSGKVVAQLFNGVQVAGQQQQQFSLNNYDLPKAVYFLEVNGTHIQECKQVFIK